MRETVAEGLSELVYTIVQCVNRQQYMPPTPTRSGVDDVFDTSFVDVQPYLYKLQYKVNDGRQNRKRKCAKCFCSTLFRKYRHESHENVQASTARYNTQVTISQDERVVQELQTHQNTRKFPHTFAFVDAEHPNTNMYIEIVLFCFQLLVEGNEITLKEFTCV